MGGTFWDTVSEILCVGGWRRGWGEQGFILLICSAGLCYQAVACALELFHLLQSSVAYRCKLYIIQMRNEERSQTLNNRWFYFLNDSTVRRE